MMAVTMITAITATRDGRAVTIARLATPMVHLIDVALPALPHLALPALAAALPLALERRALGLVVVVVVVVLLLVLLGLLVGLGAVRDLHAAIARVSWHGTGTSRNGMARHVTADGTARHGMA